MEYETVSHDSLKPFVPVDAKILILGSLPSVKSREENFYYAHPQNRFFKTLAKVFGENTPILIEEKKLFLIKHKIALYDVIFQCDIVGSNDASIKNIVPATEIIEKIIKENDILAVFTTGKLASKLYKKYIGNDNIELPSTSPANAFFSLEKLVEEYNVITEFVKWKYRLKGWFYKRNKL